MQDMIGAIITDNQYNVVEKGFTSDDIIDTYEQACEVMQMNEKVRNSYVNLIFLL